MKLFVENLTHVDLSYFDAERGLLGESWQADITLTGKLNDESMICDFSIVKKRIKKWLDENIDHMLVVPAKHKNSTITTLNNNRVSFQFQHNDGRHFQCDAPTQAICALPTDTVTPENAARWIESKILDLLPVELEAISLQLSSERIDGAQYQYSHGLKKHAGNCQRIAHGHRSTIKIYLDGIRSPSLEQNWAQRWKDIYLGTDEDLLGIIQKETKQYHHFAYESTQGLFELKIDSKQVYMINEDTTVESLSAHIAGILATENPGKHLEVYAFEGIGKGAISEKQTAA